MQSGKASLFSSQVDAQQLPELTGLRAASRRIAESMKRINSDHEARQARSESAMGVPKTCAVCGLPGHNKRTCPQVAHPAVRLTRRVLCTPVEKHGANYWHCREVCAWRPDFPDAPVLRALRCKPSSF